MNVYLKYDIEGFYGAHERSEPFARATHWEGRGDKRTQGREKQHKGKIEFISKSNLSKSITIN